MTEVQVVEFLLDLGLLFALTYLLSGLREQRRIPEILAALFVAMAVRYTPLGERLLSPEFHVPLAFLADLGALFLFFFIGLQIDLQGLFREPALAILLYLAGTIGKLVGVFLMVPMGKITVREAWTIGIGLDARLTTEIIVAQLLFDAKLIDGHLFTALVSAAAFTAITVPLVFALLMRRWGEELRAPRRLSKNIS